MTGTRPLDEEVDPRLWRTELLAHGDGSWSLKVDGKLIARAADELELDNSGARAWARRQLGEGCDFLPVFRDDIAERAVARGDCIDWAASPDGVFPGGGVDPAVAKWRDDRLLSIPAAELS